MTSLLEPLRFDRNSPARLRLASSSLAVLAALLGACAAGDEAEPDPHLGPGEVEQTQAQREQESSQTSDTASRNVSDEEDEEDEEVPLPLGQSGSEGGSRVPCPCGLPQNGNLIRATVTAVEGEELSLHVEEVLPGAQGLSAGQDLTARWTGQLPCWDGCTSVSVGDEVLATYSHSYTCVAETPDDCPGPNPRPAQVRLTHWEEEVVLGRTTEEYRFPISQLQSLAEMTDVSACIEAFGDVGQLPQAFSDTSEPTPFRNCQ